MLLHHFMQEMFENCRLLSPGSGTTLEYAKQNGCKIVSVTSQLAYTIKDLSDHVLEAKKDGTCISYTASVVAVNMLLDRIMENYEDTMKILKTLHRE